jgi:toxin-antitoxin system PIN domain toxin
VRIVDANVLVYAVNEDAPEHRESDNWLARALTGDVGVGFAWMSLLAFVRLTTMRGLFPNPLTTDAAMSQVEHWLTLPAAHIVEPTARHPDILRGLLATAGTGGNLVNDAHLAALAIEHRAEVVTYDRDFARFPGVRSAPPSTGDG